MMSSHCFRSVSRMQLLELVFVELRAKLAWADFDAPEFEPLVEETAGLWGELSTEAISLNTYFQSFRYIYFLCIEVFFFFELCRSYRTFSVELFETSALGLSRSQFLSVAIFLVYLPVFCPREM
jgi:hypothetical protein